MAEKVDQDVLETFEEVIERMPLSVPQHVIMNALSRMKEAGRQQGLREAAEVARTWGERSTTPGEPTIWHAIGISIADDITALMEGEGK